MNNNNGASTFRFGPDSCLVGAISDPKSVRSPVGAVIWGMGAGELRVARSLARLGIVAMLLRQKERAFLRLDTEGVRYCQAAVEFLREKRGVEKFILVGTCGRASISFYTAVDDPSVVGLILSNPAVSPVLTVLEKYKHRLRSAASWRRLLAGKIDLAAHFRAAKRLKTLLLGRLTGANESALIKRSGTPFSRDLMLPANAGPRLEALAKRGVRVLLVFSEQDPGLGYFRKLYGRSFERLDDLRGMSVEVLATSAHGPAQDDSSAGAYADTVRRWAESAEFAISRESRPTEVPKAPGVASPRDLARHSDEGRRGPTALATFEQR